MKAAIVLCWVHLVALSVWLGGIVALGAVAAPAVFSEARGAGDTRRGTVRWDFAGDALATAFQRFSYLAQAAGTAMVIAGPIYGIRVRLGRRRVWVRSGLTALAWISALWMALVLFPQMMYARQAGQMETFDRLHQLSSLIFRVQALILVVVAALTAWMHLDRDAPGT